MAPIVRASNYEVYSQDVLLFPATSRALGAKNVPWKLGGGMPVFVGDLSVHEYRLDAFRFLARLLERGFVEDRGGVEDDEVGKGAFLDPAATFQANRIGRQRRHSANRFRKAEDGLLAHVASEHARKAPISCRVGFAFAVVVGVGDERDIRSPDELAQTCFAGDVENELADIAVFFDHEGGDSVERRHLALGS